ncbi:MAG: sigma-70 family RNA polymerase sigma factor [Clostridia bacterium]|nr:sigma-70 family RNA polymerase sigma factor [Clostridia bacterium]
MSTVQGPNRTASETISRLIATHQTALLRLCFAYLHDEALAEDAVQETFLKAYRSLHRFRSDASEKSWLTAIAMNTCRDLRKSGWFRFVDRTVTPEQLPDPACAITPQDGEVTASVMNLPIRLREAVLLYYYQDMTLDETAQVLGISHQAVSDRLSRARKKLKTVLERSDLHA